MLKFRPNLTIFFNFMPISCSFSSHFKKNSFRFIVLYYTFSSIRFLTLRDQRLNIRAKTRRLKKKKYRYNRKKSRMNEQKIEVSHLDSIRMLYPVFRPEAGLRPRSHQRKGKPASPCKDVSTGARRRPAG